MKALVGASYQEKALVRAFSGNVQLCRLIVYMSYGHLVPEEAPLRDQGGVVPVLQLAGHCHQGEPALLDPGLYHLALRKMAMKFRGKSETLHL